MAAPDLADRAAPAELSAPERPARGFFDYQRLQVTLPAGAQTRDVVRAGKVVALLPLDLERGEIVMIRQFRPAAHLANGKGELVEIVATNVALTPRDQRRVASFNVRFRLMRTSEAQKAMDGASAPRAAGG